MYVFRLFNLEQIMVKKLLFLCLIICLCVGIVSGITETFTLTESSVSSSSYTNSASNGMTSTIKAYIDFSLIGRPTKIVYYFTPIGSPHPYADGTFILNYGTTEISTGHYTIGNGTTAGGNTYLDLTFDSWNSGSLTSCQQMNLTFSGSLDSSRYVDNNIRKVTDSDYCDMAGGGGLTNPFQFDRVDGNYYAVGGTYYILRGADASATFTLTNATPISPTTGLILGEIIRGGEDPTLIRVYANNNTLKYSTPTDENPYAFDIIGADVWASMYVPAAAKFVNSSIYFPYYTSVTPTPTPTPTLLPGQKESPITITDASSHNLIPNAGISIYNNNLAKWTNVTAASGIYWYTANISEVIDVYATKASYNPNSKIGFVITADSPVEIALVPYTSGVAGVNVVYDFIVNDATTMLPIENALVVVRNTSVFSTQNKYTNAAGNAQIIIPTLGNSTYAYVDVSKAPDYYGTTFEIELPSSLSSGSQAVYLQRKTTAPTATWTQPTASPTIIATPTIIGWNGTGTEEVTCIQAGNTKPSGWGYWDEIKNGIACSGVKGKTNQNLALSLIIMMICALILSRYAKGIGALSGIMAGAAFSFGMNILPIWLLIFVLIVCGMVLAKLIVGGTK